MSLIDRILLKLPPSTESVVAVTYYGVGFISTDKGETVSILDNLHHFESEAIASEVNYRIRQT